MPEDPTPPCVHYIGFRDDRYWNAYRIFGGPRFIHRRWDARARRDIGPGDVVIFAEGDEHRPIAKFNGDDIDERDGWGCLTGGVAFLAFQIFSKSFRVKALRRMPRQRPRRKERAMDATDLDESKTRALATLNRLASVLGRPVSIFFNPEKIDSSFKETSELLELWKRIADPEGRERLLMHARQIAMLSAAQPKRQSENITES